jgi:hypothetical protein
MASVLPAFPALPAHTMTLTLGGAQYVVRLVWRDRTQGWYFDLYGIDETPIVQGRRLSPGWGPLLGLMAPLPSFGGQLVVVGLDRYAQADLGPGRALQVLYITDAEIAAATPKADPEAAITVEVP